MQQKWSILETQKLIDVFQKHGLKECYKIFNYRSNISIKKKLNKLNFFTKNTQSFIEDIYPFTPESSYFMGLMWADGCIKNTKNRNRVSITLINEDYNNIFSKINCIQNWQKYNHDSLKKHTNVRLNNKELCNFFKKYDYENKTYCSFSKIWKNIPENFHGYFLRGYTDGDGHIYYNFTKNKITTKRIAWTAHSEYDYSFFCNYLDQLNIKYCLHKNIHSKNLIISRYDDILKIGNIIYNDFNFGLQRKYDKFKFIKNYYEQKRI